MVWLLPPQGAGREEVKKCHVDYDNYDHAYAVCEIWQLPVAIGLSGSKDLYLFKSSPQVTTYTRNELKYKEPWARRERLRSFGLRKL